MALVGADRARDVAGVAQPPHPRRDLLGADLAQAQVPERRDQLPVNGAAVAVLGVGLGVRGGVQVDRRELGEHGPALDRVQPDTAADQPGDVHPCLLDLLIAGEGAVRPVALPLRECQHSITPGTD